MNKQWRDGFISYSIYTNFLEINNVQLMQYFRYELAPILKQLEKRDDKGYKFLFGNEPTVVS